MCSAKCPFSVNINKTHLKMRIWQSTYKLVIFLHVAFGILIVYAHVYKCVIYRNIYRPIELFMYILENLHIRLSNSSKQVLLNVQEQILCWIESIETLHKGRLFREKDQMHKKPRSIYKIWSTEHHIYSLMSYW